VNQGESDLREFKSSLLFDHKRAQRQPGVKPRDCKSDEVLFSTLKTVAAFLNSEGGTLVVGVSDSGEVLGLEYDFQLQETPNADKWELHIRNIIKSRFLDGGAINDYVRITVLEISGKQIAQIDVLPRPDISFVTKESREYCVFRRQGNSTTQVQITEFEEFLVSRERRRNALGVPTGSSTGVSADG
jgi:predicted HTH transcriptional regulator